MNKSKSKEMKELLSEKGRKYNCQECGKQMANMSSFYTHIRAAHQGVKQGVFLGVGVWEFPTGNLDF